MYNRNGILEMLKQNASLKLARQRWQESAPDGESDVQIRRKGLRYGY
ncbi:hypothetical protein BVRB_8g193250 [Beta vulgaris subsp. vulgaris]|nr:hypothetical protein BVRB_8g193250 [Beta vulgaris subsp. vulgaris]